MVRIDENGNVGIGNTSPDEKLRVDGNIKTSGDFIGALLKLGFAGTALITTNDTNEDLFINPNGVGDILMQTSGGNVGIGTTNPSAALEVASTGTETEITLTNSTNSTTLQIKGDNIRLGVEGDARFSVGPEEISLENSTVGVNPQTATGDGATTIDWKLGNFYHLQMGAQTETVTFTNPTKPGVFKLKVTQPATGGLLRTANLPTTIKWLGGNKLFYTNGNSAVDMVDLYFDGTDWFGEAKKDFKTWAI